MNVALFGGTFDPVHLGHLAVARAAQQRFQLGRVYLVPADVPPHKQKVPITPYHHRYAMLALATQGEKDIVPSLLEAPDAEGGTQWGANYSIDTVRRFKQTLKKSDRLFFLIGIDAFLDVAKWREPEALLRECEFIVVSRPGFSLADVAGALPESMRPADAVLKPFQGKSATGGDIVLGGAAIHLLEGLQERVSATQVRQAAAQGRAVNRWLAPAVAEYIKKLGLYRTANTKGAAKPSDEPDVHAVAEVMQPAPLSGSELRNNSRTTLHIVGGKARGRRTARPEER
ncbi:MAG TPA: nicotinate-nucleotide adenylyltransferase [Terriglobales bacterium]|nr:nicotinate-nucleotide adenylyltransferase [Terriglobales bacterium]